MSEIKPGQELWIRVEPNRVIEKEWFTPATICPSSEFYINGTKIKVKVIEVIEDKSQLEKAFIKGRKFGK